MAEAESAKSILKKAVPEQHIKSGMAISIDLGQYFQDVASDNYEFTSVDLPEYLNLDKRYGTMTGTAPVVPLRTTDLVSVRVENHTKDMTVTSFFPLTTLTEAETLPTADMDAVLAQTMGEVNFFDAAQRWELLSFIQYFISEHFTAIYFFDGDAPPSAFGSFISMSQAESGWIILHYESAIVISPGELAFTDGNRARLLSTVKQVYASQGLAQRNWKAIGLGGSDAESIGKAWIIGKLMEMPVTGETPTETARYNLENIVNAFGPEARIRVKPTAP